MADKRAQLKAAVDVVHKRLQAGVSAAEIIAELVRDHGATHTPRWDKNRLSVAGIRASCTFSADAGLLDNWRKNATVFLMQDEPEPVR